MGRKARCGQRPFFVFMLKCRGLVRRFILSLFFVVSTMWFQVAAFDVSLVCSNNNLFVSEFNVVSTFMSTGQRMISMPIICQRVRPPTRRSVLFGPLSIIVWTCFRSHHVLSLRTGVL